MRWPRVPGWLANLSTLTLIGVGAYAVISGDHTGAYLALAVLGFVALNRK